MQSHAQDRWSRSEHRKGHRQVHGTAEALVGGAAGTEVTVTRAACIVSQQLKTGIEGGDGAADPSRRSADPAEYLQVRRPDQILAWRPADRPAQQRLGLRQVAG
jgi:hypothetical protein